MSPDVLTQLRTYAEQLDTQVPSLEQLLQQPTAAPPPRPPRRGWATAVLAAVAVLALIGVVAVGMFLWGGDEPPVVTGPPTSTTSSVPPPAMSEAGTSWARVPHDEGVFGPAHPTAIHDVASGDFGYVAVGWAGDRTAVWASADGTVWEQVPVDPALFGDATMASITAGGPGLVAVGRDAVGGVVWTSPDGIEWTRAPDDPIVFGGASIHALASGRDRLVAGGTRDGRAALWHSLDGMIWEQAVVNDGQGANVRAITVGGPGFVAVGTAPGLRGAVWTSADGLTWTVVDPGTFRNTSIETVASTGTSVIAFGQDNSFGEDGHPALWTSPDGVTWTRADLDPDVFERASVNDLIAAGPGYVAVGGAAMWASQNGRDWEATYLDAAVNDRAVVIALTAGPDRLVAVGNQLLSPSREVGAVWVSPPDLVPATPPSTSSTVTTVAGDGAELSWQRIPIDPVAYPDGRLYDVAAGDNGLFALGFGREADGTTSRLALNSPDGFSWDTTAVLDRQPILASIAAGGPGLVAAGRVDADNCYGADAAFSYSDDGINWMQVPHEPEIFGDAEVYNVLAGGPGLVAVGETCLETPVVQSTDEGSVVWTSPDGITWDRVAEPAGLDEAYWLESVGGRLVAMGWEPTDGPRPIVTAFVSEDGSAWRQVFREERGDEFADYNAAGRRGSELLRVQGARGTGSMTVWSSPDGVTWARAAADITDVGRLRALAGVGSWWVAAGLTLDEVPAVWTSRNGLEWTRLPDDGSIFGSGGGIVDMVPHGSNLVAVGMVIDEDGEHPAAWVATP